MAIGDPITPAIPPVGTPGPQFATDINAILTEVVARLEAKVPLSSVDFGSDLNMAGAKIFNVGYITVQGELVSPPASPVNRLTTFAGDFWYVGPSGAVKITNGASLNAAGIGGITGDYGGVNPAQFRFDDLNQRYDAYDDFGGGAWAFLRARGFDIAAGATSTVSARLLFAGASNKTYTLPPAAAVTGEKPLFIDTSGNITVGHTAKEFRYSAAGASPINTSMLPSTNFFCDFQTAGRGGMAVNAATTTESCIKPIDGLQEGMSMASIDFHLTKVGVTNTFLALYRMGPGTNPALVGSVNTAVNGAQTVTLALGPEVVGNSLSYFVRWFPNGGGNGGETWHGFTVNASLPA